MRVSTVRFPIPLAVVRVCLFVCSFPSNSKTFRTAVAGTEFMILTSFSSAEEDAHSIAWKQSIDGGKSKATALS